MPTETEAALLHALLDDAATFELADPPALPASWRSIAANALERAPDRRYQTMRAIRLNPRFRSLPIIAITAKALKDDRDKCIEAGASDYLPKPVDTEKLLELIKLWLRS